MYKKRIVTVVLACLLPSVASADWFFRGTSNNWAATAMESIGNDEYRTCQTFGAGDTKFKIDRFGNWSENYPNANFQVNANTTQLIVFNAGNKNISATETLSCSSAGQPTVVTLIDTERGPYLQNLSDSHITIRWTSHSSESGFLRYGTQADNLDKIAEGDGGKQHTVILNDLLPNTKYFYAIGGSANSTVRDNDMFFKTAPVTGTKQAARIWVLGDSGQWGTDIKNVYKQYLADAGSEYTNLWLMLGDNAYGEGTDSQYKTHLFTPFAEILKQTVLWPTYGNHDAESADSVSQTGPYYDIFNLPKAGESGGVSSGTEAYHSFNYGNIHFVNLDSAESSYKSTEAMLAWLKADLQDNAENNQTDWLIAFFHHPPYTKGSHDSDDDGDRSSEENNARDGTNYLTDSTMKIMRERYIHLLEKYSADLVLSGHSHSYERSILIGGHYGKSSEFANNPAKFTKSANQNQYIKPAQINTSDDNTEGTLYVVAGSSAKDNGNGSLMHPVMVEIENGKNGTKAHGSVVLELDDTGLTLKGRMIDDFGNEKDQFTLTKSEGAIKPIAIINAASRTVPIGTNIGFNSNGSSDQDGHIVSQIWALDGVDVSTDSSINIDFGTFGLFELELTVVDNEGNEGKSSISITVSDDFTSTFDALSLRGTNNGWVASAMTLVAENTWQAEATFSGSNARFKFDRFANWSENYGDINSDGIAELRGADIKVAAGVYNITFNDADLHYTLEKIGGELSQDFPAVDFRGTSNSWGKTPMTLVADFTWQIDVVVGSGSNERFKFFTEHTVKWYGDSNSDGKTHSNESGDISLNQGAGTYRITLQDNIRSYTVEKL